jgi:hypothetical protein
MKSLRTDDILGARPRILHAPRAIVREQYPQNYQHRESFTYEPQYMSNINLSESYHEKSPQMY